jgi:regulator of cell morphogenesis and NO signaling
MKEDLIIDASWTVNDVIEKFPDSIAILNSLGVDSCCGGHLTLSEAAAESMIEVETLLTELTRGTRQPQSVS